MREGNPVLVVLKIGLKAPKRTVESAEWSTTFEELFALACESNQIDVMEENL